MKFSATSSFIFVVSLLVLPLVNSVPLDRQREPRDLSELEAREYADVLFSRNDIELLDEAFARRDPELTLMPTKWVHSAIKKVTGRFDTGQATRADLFHRIYDSSLHHSSAGRYPSVPKPDGLMKRLCTKVGSSAGICKVTT